MDSKTNTNPCFCRNEPADLVSANGEKRHGIVCFDKKKAMKDNNQQGNGKPVNTTPMDSADDVKRAKDENIDKDFPGYPHYPASEDIMNPKNNTGRVTGELDNESKRDLNKMQLDNPSDKTNPYTQAEKDELGLVPGTDGDVNENDLTALEAIDETMGENDSVEADGNETDDTDELTKKDLDDADAGIDKDLARTGDDLDMPYQDDETTTEALGQGDEENNYYSLGGDSKEQNEEPSI